MSSPSNLGKTVVEQDRDREENVEFGRRGEFDPKRGSIRYRDRESGVFFLPLSFFQSLCRISIARC